jgi:quercetin dioxygenase-like cupin family protein
MPMKTSAGATADPAEPADSEVVRLADLVSYQDGSVVSRQLLKKEAGNVTLFAFAAGQSLSERTAPFDALVQVLDGEATVTVAGRPYSLRTGDAIVMPANRPHALDAVTPFKMAAERARLRAVERFRKVFPLVSPAG